MSFFNCVLSPEDSPTEVTRKKVMIVTAIISIFSTLMAFTSAEVAITKATLAVTLCAGSSCLLFTLIKKRAPSNMITGLLVIFTIRILWFDTMAWVGREPLSAPTIVLLLDIALLCRLKRSTSLVILTAVTIQQLILAFEGSFRIGVTEITSIDIENRRLDCDCVDPPCEDPTRSFHQSLGTLGVLFLDFYFTKTFADSVIQENLKMESSIRTTHAIAKHIVAFEIEEAQQILEAAERLPEELSVTLGRILLNLKQYKPYLPQSCFQSKDDSESESEHASSHHSTSSTTSTSVLPPAPKTVALQVAVTKGFASLLVANIQSSLSILHSNLVGYASLHSTATEVAMSAFGKYRGVLELFIGDRFHASFNAVKQNYSHAKSAVLGAATFRSLMKEVEGELSVNVAISTGSLVKGDLGSQVLRRFTEVGRPVIEVHVMERYGNMFNHSLLCSRKTCDESGLPNMMLLSDTIWCCGEESLLFELQQSGQAQLLRSESEVKDGEWMYHIGNDDNCTDEKRNKEMFLYLKQSLLPYPQRDLDALNSCETFKPDLISELKKSDSRQRSPLIFSFTAKDS